MFRAMSDAGKEERKVGSLVETPDLTNFGHYLQKTGG